MLPVETRQYPYKIVANAFNLAESTHYTVGFSGTKDNSIVLPPEVEQYTLDHLKGTDGKMLACVAKECNSRYHCGGSKLKNYESLSLGGWKGTLEAIFEAGGLLAGWMLLNRTRTASEISEDALMQAVGRMRKIHFNQSVAFYGPPEVTNSIREECARYSSEFLGYSGGYGNLNPISSTDLLFWVTLNTIRGVEGSILPWTSQGAIYCSVSGDPARALLDENCDLSTF